MAGRLRRTVVAVTLVVLLLPLAAATSLADTGPAPTEVFKFSDNGYSASADEGQCTDRGRHRDLYLHHHLGLLREPQRTGLRRNPRDGGVLRDRHRCLQPGNG